MRVRLGGALAVAAVVSVALSLLPSITSSPGAAAPGRAVADSAVSLHASTSPVRGLETGYLDVPDLGGGAHRVRVGTVAPRGVPVADVLFLHGHADRLDNHAALFTELAEAGYRVVSFDLPSHGLTDAGPIDVWSFADLADLASRVDRATLTDVDRPFVLAGWSFGGLLATRIAQDPRLRASFERPLSALALEVPALAPFPAAGGDGVSRLRALTHDLRAPVAGPPKPASPLLDPIFAVRLLAQAEIASSHPLPAGLPALVELSDPRDDLYVDVRAVRRWAGGLARRDGADVTVRTCSGARHGLDIEAYPLGRSARTTLVAFLDRTLAHDTLPSASKGAPCR